MLDWQILSERTASAEAGAAVRTRVESRDHRALRAGDDHRRGGKGDGAVLIALLFGVFRKEDVVGFLHSAACDEGCREALGIEPAFCNHHHIGLGTEVRARRGGHDENIDVLDRRESGLAQELLPVAVSAHLVGVLEEE